MPQVLILVENLYLSWLWWLHSWIAFKQLMGMICTLCQQRCYGWITRKDTLLLYNNPALHQMGTSNVHCPKSKLVLRGKVLYKGRYVWRTKLSQSYPPRLAKAYGILYEHAPGNFERCAVEQGLPILHAEMMVYPVSKVAMAVRTSLSY